MSDDNFDHISTKSIWRIAAIVTTNAMTDRVDYYVVLNGSEDYPEPERIIDRATGGHAKRIQLLSMKRIGDGVSLDFDDGFVIVDPSRGDR